MTSDLRSDATDVVAALDGAVCSDGAPSARNLIVTVFGDLVLPNESEVGEVSVQALSELLEPFGVSDRLVRTSLSRIVGDGLLTARSEGRRSFYSVADDARATFARADRRIYRGGGGDWDGEWTIVVIDGTTSTPADRAELRRRLGWAGFGSVGPNVMASPLVDAETAVEIVGTGRPSGSVMITRSRVIDGAGLIGTDLLVRRAVDLDRAESAHRNLVERFEGFDDRTLERLDDDRCLKLRLLLVAAFRRVALAEPSVPPTVLPEDWVGDRSRRVAGRIYESIAHRSDRRAGELLGVTLSTPAGRFAPAEAVAQPPTGSSTGTRCASTSAQASANDVGVP